MNLTRAPHIMDPRTREGLRNRLGLHETPYRLDADSYDPEKTFKQLALDTLQKLPDDAPWELVVEQLKKAKYHVFDQASYQVGERPPTPVEETIPSSKLHEARGDD